mgnify:CR=1 FL=1
MIINGVELEYDDKAVSWLTDNSYSIKFGARNLRRLIEKQQNFSQIVIKDVMSKNPRTIAPGKLAAEAVSMMEKFRINQLLVTDPNGKLVGALHIHDLTEAKVI